MAKYKSYDYTQEVMIPVSLEDQLMPGTLEFAIHTLVETRMILLSLMSGTPMMRQVGGPMTPRSF
jgi:hypothetical protein